MARAERQIVRVIALAQALLTARHGVAIKQFAESRGWPRRYIYRDKEVLEAAGFPVQGSEDRYWLPREWTVLRQAGASPQELLALHLLREASGPLRGTALAGALDDLWAKLARDGEQGELWPASEAGVAIRPAGAVDYRPHRETIAGLDRAIQRREAVWARYRRPRSGEVSERVIEPGELYFDPGLEALYCIAWCRLREDVRVFAVHRFLEVRATGETVRHRAETRSKVALRAAFRLWRSNAAVRVRLRFSASVASEITERRWHPSQVVTPTVDGGIVMAIEVADPAELERWLLGFGPDVEVLEPRELAAHLRARHAAAARQPDHTARLRAGSPPAARRGTARGGS